MQIDVFFGPAGVTPADVTGRAVAVIDVAWAHVATRRVTLSVMANPALAIVGDTVSITLALDGPRHFVRVSLLSFTSTRSDVGGGWHVSKCVIASYALSIVHPMANELRP